MSNTNATEALSGGTPESFENQRSGHSHRRQFAGWHPVIGGFLARLAGRSEQEVMTFMTIPATISGGPSIFQVRIGSGEVLSSGDEADMLLAFYQHSYEDHIGSLKRAASCFLIPITSSLSPNGSRNYHHVGVPIASLTVEAIGGTAKDKGKTFTRSACWRGCSTSTCRSWNNCHRTIHRQGRKHC